MADSLLPQLACEHIAFDVRDRVVDDAMRYESIEPIVPGIFVRRHKRARRVNHFASNGVHVVHRHFIMFNHLGFHATAAFGRADNWRLGRAATARRRRIIITPVLLAWLPADIRFIHLDKAGQQLAIVGKRGPNPVHHFPRRRLLNLDISRRLQRRQSFFGIEHESNEQEPLLQINMRVVKNGSDRCRKALVTGPALPAIGLRLLGMRSRRGGAAIDAFRAVGPAHPFEMFCCRLPRGEAAVNFNEAGHHLFQRLRRQIGDAFIRGIANVSMHILIGDTLNQFVGRPGNCRRQIGVSIKQFSDLMRFAHLPLEMCVVVIDCIHNGATIRVLARTKIDFPGTVSLELILIVPVLVIAGRDDRPLILADFNRRSSGQSDGAGFGLGGSHDILLLWCCVARQRRDAVVASGAASLRRPPADATSVIVAQHELSPTLAVRVMIALANLPRVDSDPRVFRLCANNRLAQMLDKASEMSGVVIPDGIAFHIFRHSFGALMRRVAGLDTSGLVATGAWKSEQAARIYEHTEFSEEAAKAAMLPTRKSV